MVREMKIGLFPNSESSLKMIPTFITKLPTGLEVGVAYALDIGGSNLRVLKVNLDGRGQTVLELSQRAEIPAEIQQSDAETLFGFIADQVEKIVENKEVKVGFTFSFPIEQRTINSGILINWTKGFTASGVENKDVVALFNDACEKRNINAKVNVLINDTVGTLITGCYQEVNCDCCVGVILGTGTNACYIEKIENIKKYPHSGASKDECMVINLEMGNFGSKRIGDDLPMTKWDRILNNESNNPNNQIFEKQVSGMYLGEIVRLVIIDLINTGKIFKEYKSEMDKYSFNRHHGFPTKDMSDFESDNSPNLDVVNRRLTFYGIKSTLDERRIVKNIVRAVATRGAVLAATQIAACLKQMNKENKNVVIAVDGSLFEKYKGFREKIDETLTLLLKHNKVKLILSTDGSGVGAALASFMQQQ